jgi:multiple sugar transport system substrate-binding protein
MSSTRRDVLRNSVVLTSALGGAALAACAGGSGGTGAGKGIGGMPSGPVTVTYLSYFAAGHAQSFLFAHALKTFQERYPSATIDHQVDTGDTLQKFQALAAAGLTPDVVSLRPQHVEPLRAPGALADLTPYVKRDAKAFGPEDFVDAALQRSTRAGKWHALPLQMGLLFLVYSVGALQQAGVGRPDASWTWDHFLNAVRATMGRDAAVLGTLRPAYELPVRANGGDILSKDETKCLLDQPIALDAIQWNADLQLKHRVVPTAQETGGQNGEQLFIAGRYAIYIADSSDLATIQRAGLSAPWDIAVLPKGTATRVSTAKGPSLALSAASKQRDAAWAWLLHYMSPEMQRYVAMQSKILTARKSTLQEFLKVDGGLNEKVVLETTTIAKPLPYVARSAEIDKLIADGLNAVYGGQRSAKDAMADVVRQVNAILAESVAR